METVSGENSQVSPPKKRPAVIKWVLVLSIAIVINLFLTYVVDVLYNAPEYTNFCPERQVNRLIETEKECVEMGGQWNENIQAKGPQAIDMAQPAGYCNTDYTCAKNFEEVLKLYNRNVFLVFVVAGILLLIGSVYLGRAEAVSLGLSFGGILALVIGSMRYWSAMNDVLRVIILGAALAGLIYIAWKKFQD